ncbi:MULTISPECIES: flavin reductase family protein [Heyndrickxia]|jgi:flavin reductase (DIM6/NTAB) family NADH-FMN oxidoreductase RutF|uniref:Flavin reductase n=1 Tax=Heyndrickxia oleronia TaxID=38875 RepID=A0A8E2LES2_9BACI|nr:flavin reductase family protein [Heyndrickxia oleronia]NYV68404.1 flavin reductase family protein [Bacillus sp. Gen3]MBU5213201.1 flavin reductase family protein [Heyndrickxia oleronia]MCI1591978.1 flavin reductase family protein [Heyndrickxia oleronia]MCI1613920.1 flavin reductase family protein [Heyndrickxia oleronia]MCI1745155.1 flavin reductase family protein [Heyndrickxia oleronia]
MDDRLFRNAMGKFATGVTVITTAVNGDVHGMTANAFMSVSLNPKLILISIGNRANMKNLIDQSKKFAVNILAKEQKDASQYFAGQLNDRREIEFRWNNDIPILPNSITNIVCDLYASYPAGDHTLYIGEVKDIVMNEGKPLTFYEGTYASIS